MIIRILWSTTMKHSSVFNESEVRVISLLIALQDKIQLVIVFSVILLQLCIKT